MVKKSYREPESNIRLGILNNNTFAPVKGNYWKKGIEACKSELMRKKQVKLIQYLLWYHGSLNKGCL